MAWQFHICSQLFKNYRLACTSGKLLWLITGLAWYGVGGLLDLEYRDLVDFFAWCSMCCSRVPKCFGHLHEEKVQMRVHSFDEHHFLHTSCLAWFVFNKQFRESADLCLSSLELQQIKEHAITAISR